MTTAAGAAAMARALRTVSAATQRQPPPPPRARHAVRMLTFNIWFEPLCLRQRLRAIGQIVTRTRPAVVGFQEMTMDALAVLRAQSWAQFYDCSIDTAPPCSSAYFVVLFSALPVRSIETTPFANTGMGRELVAMQVQVTDTHSLWVGTSHLESLPQSRSTRLAQLQTSLDFLSARVNQQDAETEATTTAVNANANAFCLGAIFMGDTNLLKDEMKLLDARGAEAAALGLVVERAKSGRAKCRACSQLIHKEAIRVGKTNKEVLPNGKVVELCHWFHDGCFLSERKMRESEKNAVRALVESETAPPSQEEGTQKESNTNKKRKREVTEMQKKQQEMMAKAEAEAEAEEKADADAAYGLPSHWRDQWLSVVGNTEDNGYTYDAQRNTMIKNRTYRSRFDRVYWYPGAGTRQRWPPNRARSECHSTTTTSSSSSTSGDRSSNNSGGARRGVLDRIELVGTHPIVEGLWPSDHFGVLATFNFDGVIPAGGEDGGNDSHPSSEATGTKGSSADSAIEIE